ncbi:MAG: response regulator [Bryobacteraceae bacterium]|nr:response regulator [Bryobacteraceae bacterium]
MAYRVLVVDDSPAMRAFIRRVIQISGFDCSQCFEAGNGEEALSLLDREWVDLVMTDINMPRMDGEEFVRRLESNPRLSSLPVLVVSTDSTEKRIHQMLTLGAKGYVRKPFTPEALREELERMLGEVHA